MSRINRDIYTSLDVNGPYIRIDTQPTATTLDHNGDAVFTLAASTYYLTGDETDTDGTEDAVAPTDTNLDNQTPGVPHTAKDDGYISYQWYQIDANSTPIGKITKLTDSTIYSGTTTNTLTVHKVQSPGTHLNQYYCVLDYIPNLTNGQFDTGNAVNDTVTSDTVTLNVRPFLIINTHPVSTTALLNPDSGELSTKASLSDTRAPWQNYKLQFQWWEKNKENEGEVGNIRLEDKIYNKILRTVKSEETVVDQIQRTTFIESAAAGVTKRVGIPTEAVDVRFTISGGKGGSGGDESGTDVGGSGGRGRTGEFKFSSSEISLINNASGPTEYLIGSGSSGNDGGDGASASGGLGGLSYDLNPAANGYARDSVQGGKGGDSGPGGISGAGGGGGGGSAVLRADNDEWMSIAAGGGGGGGASKGADGNAGSNAGEWEEWDRSATHTANDVKIATVVNYNPVGGTPQGGSVQDAIDYGFYIKTSSPISSVNDTTTYRVVVIWDGETIVNTNTKLTEDSFGYYVTTGNRNYYLSLHRGSELGWCNDDSSDSICIRGDGGYTNTFDIFREGTGNLDLIDPHDGGVGGSKIIGDGGGGGGAGGGGLSPATGGTPGADPIPASNVDITVKVTKNASDRAIGGRYIKFIENRWYGFPESAPSRGQVITVNRSFGTQTVSLKTNTTYDVISSFEVGDRTSDGLRILQDFTPDQNAGDVIAGRSIGMDLDGDLSANIQTGNENNFLDFIVSVSDGTFDVFPETVRLDDGEIVGRAIIRFTTPAEVRNSTKATGGEGGRSVYDGIRLDKVSGSSSLNNGQGSVVMTVVTEQPFDVLDTDVTNVSITRQYQISGAHPYTPYKDSGYTSNLTITSDYVFSKRILCQVTVKDTSTTPALDAITSGSNSLYTNTVDFIVSDDRDNTIIVEQIRHNDDFAITRSLNMLNGDLTFEKTTDTSIKETEYYSFYSNNDIEVDVKMYGGKGSDVGGNTGGEGGFSYLRLNMKRDTEYVIAGLNDYVNTPFLFKKGQLLACVGAGGDANVDGDGGAGGGVSVNGGNAPAGGSGGVALTTLGTNGIHGSGSSVEAVAPDTKASGTTGGRTIRCSKGTLRDVSPCTDYSGNVKFKLSDGTEVTNTREIKRGFKSGYNIFNTGGRGNSTPNRGWGGSGAAGGNGNDRRGGGGGSGYITPDLPNDILVRSEGNAAVIESAKDVESERDTGLEGDGIDSISSTLGGSTGPAKVVISLAEVPTNQLDEFIERPATPDVTISNEDVVREPSFIPLPEIDAPTPIDPPQPRMRTTSTVSKGFTGGNQTKTSFKQSERIGVLETGSVDINVQTTDIPGNTKFYWKVTRITTNDTYSDADFDELTGNFTTNSSGAGKATISPEADNSTDFIGGNHDFRVNFYTDPEYKYQINSDFAGRFRILDNSLSAPIATFDLKVDKTGGTIKASNSINEGDSVTYDIDTRNIPNGDTLKWYVEHISTQNADFEGGVTSGTITVNSGFTVDADGVASKVGGATLSTANRGTTSFELEADEDQVTEGTQVFAFKIEYPVGSGTFITNTRTGVGDSRKSVKIIDTSKDRAADITADGDVDEGETLTVSLDTENMLTNETIYWKIYESDGVTAASTNDFKNIQGSVKNTEDSTSGPTGRTGSASFDIEPKSDETTEGPETFIVKLWENSARDRPLKIIGSTTTQSQHTFIVNDTSLDAPEYRVTLKGLTAGTPPNASENSETEITFLFEGWNLTSKASAPKIYHRVMNTDGSPAVYGTYNTDDDELNEYDFNKVTGFFTPTRAGYTKTSGSTSGGIKSLPDVSTGHIVPYFTNVESDTKFKPDKDYLDDEDGDKTYEIRFYDVQSDWLLATNDNIILTSDEFEVKNDSLPVYHFDKDRGLGKTGTENYNGETSVDPPVVDEGKIVSFRIETTAAPGTEIWYKITGVGSDDLGEVDPIPDGPADCNQYYRDTLSGSFYTLEKDSLSDSIVIDEGLGISVSKTRSIGWIFISTINDETTEGDETGKIQLFNDSSRLSQYKVAEQEFKIKDTSETIAVPAISLSFDKSGGSDTTKTVESPTSGTTEVKLFWDISGGLASDGTSGGFTSDSYLFTTSPSLPSKWYESSGSTTMKVKSTDANEGTGEKGSVTFTVEISNETAQGDVQSSGTKTATLTINHPPPEPVPVPPPPVAPPVAPPPVAPPPVAAPTTTRQSYLIHRYKRKGAGKNQRFQHSTWGPGSPFVDASYRNHDASDSEWWGKKYVEVVLKRTYEDPWEVKYQGSVGGAFSSSPPSGDGIQNVVNYKAGKNLDGFYGDTTMYAYWTDTATDPANTGGVPCNRIAWYLKDKWNAVTQYALANGSGGNPTEFAGVASSDWERYQDDAGYYRMPDTSTGGSTHTWEYNGTIWVWKGRT